MDLCWAGGDCVESAGGRRNERKEMIGRRLPRARWPQADGGSLVPGYAGSNPGIEAKVQWAPCGTPFRCHRPPRAP